ncbi:ATP-binding protein [Agrobacterium sp. DKPNP3]|uniref:ATP-binding protein n=1 Tax=Agrobacterium sp. DKPNP3 TaxID=3457323 RepID=UPI004044406C
MMDGQLINIRNLSNAMRRDFNPSKDTGIGRTVLLTGAGCSVSANIPLAKDIAQNLVRKLASDYGLTGERATPEEALSRLVDGGHFEKTEVYQTTNSGTPNPVWSAVYDQLFSNHYNSPKEVHRIFADIFEKNGKAINWTHICIGELVRVGFISTVLTTNFDQLALEGIARTGRLPVVADGLEYLGRITGDALHPQLIQIHGSRHTYHLRNSIEDTEELSRDHSARHAIDELFRTARVFLAVGYGGREKGIMELLIEAGKRYPDTRIYWCTYAEPEDELPPLVKAFLGTSKHSKVIHGFDSDQLFDELLGQLNIKAPKVIDDPLYILRELTDNIAISADSAISLKIGDLKSKTLELRTAEAHVGALDPNRQLKAMEQLTAGVAHDFNNVLTSVLLSIDHLLLLPEKTNQLSTELLEMKRNANRAAVLVRQMLAITRKQTFKPAVLDLVEVISDLRMLIDRLFSGTHVKLRLDHQAHIWPVKVDLAQFEQVLINLAVNARDAIPGEGFLTFRASNVPSDHLADPSFASVPKKDYVLLEVEDTGIGIPADQLDKIFDPYFTTKDNHTGLGLAMVYGIVRQSKGHIFVESETGRGTTFKILVPRTSDLPSQPAVQPDLMPKENRSEATGTELIVLADDEESIRIGITRTLQTRGYIVHDAASGAEALEKVTSLEKAGKKVDLVLSNVTMPKMDGPTLMNEVKKAHPHIRFLFISGYAEAAFARKLPEHSFGFLPKPFSLKQLATAVREVLDEPATETKGKTRP